MRKTGWAVLALCCTVAVAASKHPKESTDLQQKFDTEFLGKQLVSKVPLAGYLQWQLDNGSAAHRLVDTEYGLDGGMAYLVRTGTVENPGFFPVSNHIQLEQITKVYPSGTAFWVIKNEIRKDRIELWLTANNNNGQQTIENYAKLKLMLKDGYQHSASYDDLILRISDIFRIERFERLNALSAELKSLDEQLAATETRFKAATGPVAQYETAQQLQTTLQQILRDQGLYQQAGGNAIENSQYRQRLDEIQRMLPSLQAKNREILAQEFHQKLDDNNKQLAPLREKLERPVTSSSDLENYKSTLARYSAALDSREALVRRMQQENIPLSDAEAKVVQEGRLRIPTFQNRVSTDSGRVAMLDLDRQYKALSGRHRELLDKLLQSLGTANEKSNREKLVANLEEMQQNRLKAQQLGSKTALGELNRLRDELARLQH